MYLIKKNTRTKIYIITATTTTTYLCKTQHECKRKKNKK